MSGRKIIDQQWQPDSTPQGAICCLLPQIAARRGPLAARVSPTVAWPHFNAAAKSATSSACAPLAPSRIAFEEQSLTQHRGHGRGLKRLGNQEGRLRPLAGEEALGIGSDENHRHLE